jgi:hypothetical protein
MVCLSHLGNRLKTATNYEQEKPLKTEKYKLKWSTSKTKNAGKILAFLFGALLIFVTFGDAHIYYVIGNLDTILGHAFWLPLDIFYPLASIAVFLLYGWVKGKGLKFNAITILLFASYFTVLALVNIEDSRKFSKLRWHHQELTGL